MSPISTPRELRESGFTLPELLVSVALTAMIAAGMLITIVALQKAACASQHHVASQIRQSRILDYVARDLRRALTAAVDTTSGGQRLTITIPDYYDGTGKPREPVIAGETVAYGSSPLTIQYYRRAQVFYRNVGGLETALASDVADFDSTFDDSGKQTVSVTVTFQPRYRFGTNTVSTLRIGTAATNTTLLRNKRN